MVVAVVVGKPGIDTLLIISQVILSIVLPFVMFPLVWLTSSSLVMRVKRPSELVAETTTASTTSGDEKKGNGPDPSELEVAMDDDEVVVTASASASIDDCQVVALSESKEKEEEKESDVVQLETVSPIDDDSEYVDYSNGWLLTVISYSIWIVVVVANGYLIVTLAID